MSAAKRHAMSGEVLVPIAVFVLTTAYLVEAMMLGPPLERGLPSVTFFPLAISLVMYVALAFVFIREIRATRPDEAAGAQPNTGWGLGRLRRPLLIVLATVAYIVLFEILGYIAATLLYVYVILAIFGFGANEAIKGQLKRVLATVLITAAFYVFFVVAFDVRLPIFGEAF